MESSNGSEKADLNNLVKNIVKILLSTSKYFHCPFCADEYLFEFTLRHHLLKNHEEDLSKIVQSPDSSIKFCDSNICPYCGALFYYISALPKHIMNSHSRDCLIKWQAIERDSSLRKRFATEPSIRCVPCSPGLSDLFEELNTDSSRKKHRSHRRKPSPLYKSALKNANRISASKRISGESWVSCDFEFTSGEAALSGSGSVGRRSNSVRRELQFDAVASEPTSPQEPDGVCSVKKTKRARKRFNLKSLKPRVGLRKYVLSKFTKKYRCKIVTSTPNNFLDDSDVERSDSRLHNQERWNKLHLD
ncbi:AAEL004837-PA [Aedes aegypti]|uniref:AAEL004837-PA n=1 Tax=Aedes aegypti TaxID=7159 RepID=Q0IFI5_AEDAE|nr:AAEL004837-PA [Aedes aegypti]